MKALRCTLEKLISDNSMSLALLTLFLFCITGQGISGWFAYNQALQAGQFPEIPFSIYVRTGNFLDGLLSNWQAAILQLAVLIGFGSVLRQKGAAHSRKAGAHLRRLDRKFETRLAPQDWLYANSLSFAFVGMFLATFLLHLLFGDWKYNEDQALRHLPPASLGSFAGSSNFWFSVFQCWEAEFGAIALYIVLSIFLRQEGSSESKCVFRSS